jgi:hypothetical protein
MKGRINAGKNIGLDNTDYEHMFIHKPIISIAELRNVEDNCID